MAKNTTAPISGVILRSRRQGAYLGSVMTTIYRWWRCALVAFVGFDLGILSAAPPDPAALAARIDRHIETRWAADKVKPAPQADDATFVRRVYLDLTGRIPTVAEVHEFLGNRAANKRAKLIAVLVDSGAYARHTAILWRREWIPQADTPRFAELSEQVDGWLTERIREGTPYDRIVRDLLTASQGRTAPGTRPVGDSRPVTFLAAGEYQAENLAANTTRAFLGLNLDCAQCHDHPFARWKRDQFCCVLQPPWPAG
jgi:Protein of unknown function (DUF1549)